MRHGPTWRIVLTEGQGDLIGAPTASPTALSAAVAGAPPIGPKAPAAMPHLVGIVGEAVEDRQAQRPPAHDIAAAVHARTMSACVGVTLSCRPALNR
jgi:hypothetical protein